MKILVTGADGFVGKNLIAQLNNEGFMDIQKYTLKNSLNELEEFTKECDFVYHLAGVNRPKNDDEFYTGNTTFTEQLVELLENNNNSVPILLSSSIQASQNNVYGDSKKKSEEILAEYAARNNIEVMIYRLKNLFGKWSKPNYNSVVATFCYNISRNLPIQINDSNAEMSLCYIDDVIKEFIQALKSGPTKNNDLCVVPKDYKIKVGELAEKIKKFNDNRKTLIMPSLKEQFDRDLYATFLSYLDDENFSYKLKKNTDNRGWLAEFIKSDDNGQIFISTTKPGITRGNHWHQTKVEKFLVMQGKALIKLRNINNTEVIKYEVLGENLEVVDIPAGYTHSITNIGNEDIITLFWACEIFDSNNPDTYFVEV
ncbi:polysaccharide biosynthesis C-terminal domain-containing protein [Carnobacterium maltaromaticum]|uniref:polysaccharide biosynthesis C-terminal domain-containing protein n=1 Tax=Carnobacterium maltaromaticum TaxID=2751 RepID=UPI000E76237E|nr:NAD-dependent epimerase/dehydratase family protein [Carnobacterium maltaromaticum]AOA02785.1 capsular biosynthesis protein [Carnobacterium maltaromaticum]MCI1819290.1 NAD-dependent epimerase/dehydratase family protein [Carnobacterium maltaromaticum]